MPLMITCKLLPETPSIKKVEKKAESWRQQVERMFGQQNLKHHFSPMDLKAQLLLLRVSRCIEVFSGHSSTVVSRLAEKVVAPTEVRSE